MEIKRLFWEEKEIAFPFFSGRTGLLLRRFFTSCRHRILVQRREWNRTKWRWMLLKSSKRGKSLIYTITTGVIAKGGHISAIKHLWLFMATTTTTTTIHSHELLLLYFLPHNNQRRWRRRPPPLQVRSNTNGIIIIIIRTAFVAYSSSCTIYLPLPPRTTTTLAKSHG